MTNIEEKVEQKSYRGIFKATSLFGGVQVYQILIEIIKSKFIAVLLGPLGVGVQGLYQSGISLIQQLTSFGLSSSAVRNVAEANSKSDSQSVARVVCALRRLVYITGLLGMIFVIVFSPLLSKTSFGDNAHIVGFVIISITLLLNQISNGQKVILQGTRRLKYLAKSSAIGVTVGLIFAVPIYYFWGVKGIVPNIVLTAITSLVLTYYYSRKVPVDKCSLSAKETFSIGKSMLIMGVAMSLSQLFTTASAYALRGCIRLWGGVEEVGLFTAGFTLMTQYTGLVFAAMSTDYYPRLASVNNDNNKCKVLMNQQCEIGLLIIAPLLVFCTIFIPFIVIILYSDEFISIERYVIWCSVGMMFKMASWAISYVFIAKAESKIFMINEFSVGVYSLLLSLLGYKLGGLQGLGIAFAISYFLYMLQVVLIARRRYSFKYSKGMINVFSTQMILVLLSVCCVIFLSSLWKYIIGSCLLVLSALYSFRELDKRIGIKNYINSKLSSRNDRK